MLEFDGEIAVELVTTYAVGLNNFRGQKARLYGAVI